MRVLIEIYKRILSKIFAKPAMSIFDRHDSPLLIVNNFIERIFYETIYDSIYYTDHFNTSYCKFLDVFMNSTPENDDKNLKLKREFYSKVCSDVIIKMSPHIRVLFYRVYSGEVLPELTLEQTPTKITYNKLKKIAEFKTILEDDVYKMKKDEIVSRFKEYQISAIENSEPGLREYIYKYIDRKIILLSLEYNRFKEENRTPRDMLSKIAKESKKDLAALVGEEETNLEKRADYELFILRFNHILFEKELLSKNN